MRDERGRFTSKATARRVRAARRYWADVHAIQEDRDTSVSRARRYYRAAIDRLDVPRREISRKRLLRAERKVKRLPPARRRAPKPPPVPAPTAAGLRDTVETVPYEALALALPTRDLKRNSKGEEVSPITAVVFGAGEGVAKFNDIESSPDDPSMWEAHKAWLRAVEAALERMIEAGLIKAETVAGLKRAGRYARIIETDLTAAVIHEPESGLLRIDWKNAPPDIDQEIEDMRK